MLCLFKNTKEMLLLSPQFLQAVQAVSACPDEAKMEPSIQKQGRVNRLPRTYDLWKLLLFLRKGLGKDNEQDPKGPTKPGVFNGHGMATIWEKNRWEGEWNGIMTWPPGETNFSELSPAEFNDTISQG